MKATDNVLFRWIQSTLQFHGVDLSIDSLNDLQDGAILSKSISVVVLIDMHKVFHSYVHIPLSFLYTYIWITDHFTTDVTYL